MPPARAPCYKLLSHQFIRVLELYAGELSDPLSGTLVAQPVDGESFEAVSYVWGGHPTETMMVDGTPVSITVNLKRALKAFRSRPPSRIKGHVRRLWVDSVCINQDDISERSSQVELMGRIFAGASRVLTWLGDNEKGLTSFAMQVIRDILEDPGAALHEARILLHHDDSKDNDRLEKDEYQRYQTQVQRWAAIKAFFDIEYFHRTWIVQELGLAFAADMFCSNKRPVQLEDMGGKQDDRDDEHELELHSISWHSVSEFVRHMAFEGASLENHLGLKCWVAMHIRMVWDVNDDGTSQCDFLTALHWVRIMRVTDPRDRIFGLMGHPMAILNGEPVAKPDYNVTRGVVYTRLAATFIRETKNLYVLTLVDHESDQSMRHTLWSGDDARMPTWVPDWHAINRTTPLPFPVAPAANEDAEIRIVGSSDSVAGQPMPHLLVRGWVIDGIVEISHMMETADFPVTNLLNERAKKNPFYLDRLWEVVYPAHGSNYKDPIEVLDNLSLTLADGFRDSPAVTLAEGVDLSYKDATQPGKAQDMHRQSFAAYILEYDRLHKIAKATTASLPRTKTGSAFSTISNDINVPERSLYASLPESAQTEIRRRAVEGTSLSFVQDMTWVSMCRVIFRTTKGLIGMGPRVLKPNDVISRVRGSPVLMVLREAPHEAVNDVSDMLQCMYVGPAIIPERMVPDVLDGSSFDEIKKDFMIY